MYIDQELLNISVMVLWTIVGLLVLVARSRFLFLIFRTRIFTAMLISLLICGSGQSAYAKSQSTNKIEVQDPWLDPATTTVPTTVPLSVPLSATVNQPIVDVQVTERIVVPGDNLWKIALENVADRSDGTQVVVLWKQIIADNIVKLKSHDPNLIYPGESISVAKTG